MRTRRYVVRGRVQGVGFRWFVSREADRLGVSGFARNLADGSVEVVAHGSDESLQSLERALEQGPSYSRVSGVEKTDVPPDMQLPSAFETR